MFLGSKFLQREFLEACGWRSEHSQGGAQERAIPWRRAV